MNTNDNDRRTISAEQVAVLAERVDVMINGYAKLEGILLGIQSMQSQQTSHLAVVNEKISQGSILTRQLSDARDKHGEVIDVMVKTVERHTTIWKLIGALSSVALALVAAGYAEFRDLGKQVDANNNRLSIMEYLVGGRNPTPRTPSPPTSEGTK